MSLSKDHQNNRDDNRFEKCLKAYAKFLQERPVLTKAVTSGTVSALGSIISQLIVPNPQAQSRIVWRSVFAYSAFGFVFSGPLIHHFYILLDKIMPNRKGTADPIKRVIFDRFVFAPPFLLLFLYVVTILEGHGHAGAIQKIKETYWNVLKLNWKIWTVFQYINVNYVPQKYRVLVSSIVALIWTVAVAALRRKQAS